MADDPIESNKPETAEGAEGAEGAGGAPEAGTPDPVKPDAGEAGKGDAVEVLSDAGGDAGEGVEGGGDAGQAVSSGGEALTLPEFGDPEDLGPAAAMRLLGDVTLDVTIELGRTRMLVEDVLKLSDGAVVELDKLAGDPVDIYVNERLVARGEVLVLNDNFSIRVSEILDTEAIEEAGRGQRSLSA